MATAGCRRPCGRWRIVPRRFPGLRRYGGGAPMLRRAWPWRPQFVSATVIDGATLPNASPMGLQMALLFDRIVDGTTAQQAANYQIPSNAVQQARSQLSGRIVVANLQVPEGPYVPTSVT